MASEPISSNLGGFNGSSREEINVNQQQQAAAMKEDVTCQQQTDDEERVLSLDHWLHVFGRINPNVPLIQADIDYLRRVTALIRKAYISLKHSRGVIVDIVSVLDHKDSRNVLFHLAFSLSRMDEFLALLEQLRLMWLEDYPHIFVSMEPFVGRSKFTANLKEPTETQKASIKALAEGRKSYLKLEELGRGKKEAISIKIYSILLILRETLILMGVQPQVAEGNKKPVESCSAELTRLVDDGAYQLANVIGKSDIVVTKMLDSVYKDFAPDSYEYKLALGSDKIRYEWTTKFSDDLSNSMAFILNDSAEIYRSELRKLIDTTDPWNIFWYLNQ